MKRENEIWFELDCDTSGEHRHEYLEILYVLSGRVSVWTEGKNYLLVPEDMAVFNCFQPHELYVEEGGHVLSMYVSLMVVQDADLGIINCLSCVQQDKKPLFDSLRGCLSDIFRGETEHGDEYRLFVKSRLYDMLGILNNRFLLQDSQKEGRHFDKRMMDILAYLSRNFDQPLSLDRTAEHFYLSPAYFSRYFQQNMGESFSDYLRDVRLQYAVKKLMYTGEKISDIALNAGFSGSNALIDAMKKRYGMTPGEFRRQSDIHRREEVKEVPEGEGVSWEALFKYSGKDRRNLPADMPGYGKETVFLDVSQKGRPVVYPHTKGINIQSVRDLITEPVQRAIKKVKTEIGFEYLICHGWFDDEMEVYHEREDKTVEYNFMHVDYALDYLTENDIHPWIELGHTPSAMASGELKYINDSVLNLPDDSEKWSRLLDAFLKHICERYGTAQVETWGFSVTQGCYSYYDLFTDEEYRKFHLISYHTIKKNIPRALISGPGFDVGIMDERNYSDLEDFLEFAIRKKCLPDIMTFQCFHCDYASFDPERDEREFTVRSREPITVTDDEDYLQKQTAGIRGVLQKFGLGGKPLMMSPYNSTIWSREPGSDTCFKSAFMVKNVLENCENLEGIGYAQITDYSSHMQMENRIYHGGYGLINYLGIPKAVYYAYFLLNMMGTEKIASGDGWFAARSHGQNRYQIMLYHYCHYNKRTRITHQLPISEQTTQNFYDGFMEKEPKEFSIEIADLPGGRYDVEEFYINRENGSSYDIWRRIGSPENLTTMRKDLIERINMPGYFYKKYIVQKGRVLKINVTLEPHEIHLIQFEQRGELDS